MLIFVINFMVSLGSLGKKRGGVKFLSCERDRGRGLIVLRSFTITLIFNYDFFSIYLLI